METGATKGLYRDPSLQIIPTFGPKVCKFLPKSGYLDPQKDSLTSYRLMQADASACAEHLG